MRWKIALIVAVLLATTTLAFRIWREMTDQVQAEASAGFTESEGIGIAGSEGNAAVPVLVELFTSEGCSSCPPADRLLMTLDESQPIKGTQIIALSEHVDYWNRLGWADPFSSDEFSKRQSDYANAFGDEDNVYTPQMIVDGRTEFVGSNGSRARRAIAEASRAPKGDVTITVAPGNKTEPSSLKVQVSKLPPVTSGDRADVMLAITESGLVSNVSRGENSGRKLAHTAVTRKLLRIGTVEGSAFTAEQTIDLDSRWNRDKLRAIAFVQEHSSRKIIGSASVRLGSEP